jgi:hypothetical protein
VTEQQRTYLAIGSFGVALAGVVLQFGVPLALMVAGAVGVVLAIVLAIGAVR